MAIPKSLKAAQNKINKKYDAEFVNNAADFKRVIRRVPSGSFMLDEALGGGWAEGRMHEIYGPESAGKTTICLLGIASFQREEEKKSIEIEDYVKRYAVFLDAERTFGKEIAEEYGICLEDLVIIEANTAEQAMDILRAYIETDIVGMVVVDSLAALVPSVITESSFEQQTIGVQARFMSMMCMRLSGLISNHKVVALFINQIREKVGAYGN